MWFVEDHRLLHREREAIADLEESADWLAGTSWGIGGGLHLDAVIRAHGHDHGVRLTYPRLFPEVCPVVRPENPDERWSSHQYRDGALCLELGPDNWHPDFTGADLLRSAYRLIEAENPLGSGPVGELPERHSLSVGQELRGQALRFYLGADLKAHLSGLPSGAEGSVDVHLLWHKTSLLAIARRLTPKDEGLGPWEDPSVPGELYDAEPAGEALTGVFYKTSRPPEALRGATSSEHLERLLGEDGRSGALSGPEGPYAMGLEKRPRAALIVDAQGGVHLFLLLSETGARKAVAVESREGATGERLPRERSLAGKSVGVAGAGSVGAKLATSLARSGASRFVIVDEDVLLPENLCRNELDWRDVGAHKVRGLARRLRLVSPGIEVACSDLTLTGQENAAAVARVLKDLGECDLIVDATANPRVFNLLSAAAVAHAKPLVWMEVYAGGIGGMVARYRPGLDPRPQTMRAAYLEVAASAPSPPVAMADYATQTEDGSPLVASDAEVGVVAHQAAQLAADTLLGPESSRYPHSMYLMGFQAFWIFEAPLQNIPIETGHLLEEGGLPEVEEQIRQENLGFLRKLLGE